MTEDVILNGASLTIEEICRCTGGMWQSADSATRVNGVFTDTRTPLPGALFAAVRGPNFDGHNFVHDAISEGACAVLAEKSAGIPDDIPAVLVEDTLEALIALAAYWRSTVNPKIVGITGSVGKTTTKELTAHLLGSVGATAKTCGNWNNLLGLSKSLLAMPLKSDYGVFEIGSNHPGEIGALAELMEPDCAIVTNVAPSHIEFFSDETAIADEKADLIRAVPESGFVVLDACSPFFSYMVEQANCR
ncbi:MAG: UDP-N-acetylmuramoyl-tripeptide--D-alanyl-D-alanine ligase, partial [Lentisphaerae bacterium]|nr:UDP-N-acetylmuramoyl-tripeptide--D-alanyl-D-alanine ligase [Lentisphaerota bacterium]